MAAPQPGPGSQYTGSPTVNPNDPSASNPPPGGYANNPGWRDVGNGIVKYGGDALNYLSGQTPPQQTVAATAQPGAPGQLVYDPNTGTVRNTQDGTIFRPPPGYTYNPQTGTFVGPNGQTLTTQQVAADPNAQIKNPSALNQIAAMDQQAQTLRGQQAGFLGNEQQAFGQEQDLAKSFENTISNPNAPSVAREQLQQGLNAEQAQQLSAAAGVSGSNAALARQNAMRNMGSNATTVQNQQVVERAREVQNAQQGEGSVLNAMAGQSLQGYGQSGSEAGQAADQALKTQKDIEADRQNQQIKNNENKGKFVTGGLSAIASYL